MDHEAQPGAGELLCRQASSVARALLRPRSYAGLAREAVLTSFHLSTYPLGLLPGVTAGRAANSADAEEVGAGAPAGAAADMPVMLVHGYVHNRSAFLVMSRALRRAGFRTVQGLNYNPLVHDLDQIAALLDAEIARLRRRTGAPRVHLVGHSMGGIIARHYVQLLGGEDTVATCVTIGAPHRGSYSSYLGPGPAAAQLRPGSGYLRHLEETARPSQVRWIALWSDLDLMVVPAANARLVHPALQAENVRIRNTGHLSLLLSREVLRRVVGLLGEDPGGEPAQGVASLPATARG
ncbi:esterase/lipase family protein [Egibacter rhizosphaerae]|uniref:esterase/lipase family protein n=1 Tax=Egibacter rhizosphaerae TaxID=1670831 RepID=UPI0013F15956|nr:alpha/beta fold hydrolase [Egibacter rhizosphaerae]